MRTEKDWRGKEKLTARMTGVSPEQVATAVARAQSDWDTGWLVHIYKPSALAQFEAEGLQEVIHQILVIGWKLQSGSLGNTTVGMNTQQAMFVFTRPARP